MEKISEDVVARFLTIGYGYGDGSGDGDGYGDGSGYGSGYGSGSGSGSGYGSGSGDGDGYGDGSGYGSGYGSGSGDGCGSGSGSGIAAFCGDTVHEIDDIQTIIRSVHGNTAMGAILHNDLTLEKCYIVKGGGFFAHGASIRLAQEALEEKIVDNMPVEEKIAKFIDLFVPGTKYPASDFYLWHNTLTGSCEMGRKAFAKDHEIDIDNDTMTPEEFIALTKNAYGGSIIRQLKEAMEAAQ